MNLSRYNKELLYALAIYLGMLVGSIELLKSDVFASFWRPAIALSPMIAVGFAAWVILRQLQRLDELQRSIQLEAFGFAFAGTAIATFAYGFLEGLGYPRLTMFLVGPIMAALWVIGGMLARRRYR